MALLRKILDDLRAHRVTFLIALTVTGLGLGLYFYTYIWLHEPSESPLAKFLEEIELKSYDFRFLLRGRTEPSPEIVIVGVDQSTLWRIGSYPFPRHNWAAMLDRLGADGARVIGFDINFQRPDDKSAVAVLEALQQQYRRQVERGVAPPSFLDTLEQEAAAADHDGRLARAVTEAGNVVLGYNFEISRENLGEIDEAAQEEIDGWLPFASYSTVGAKDGQGNDPPPLPTVFTGERGFLASPPIERFADAAGFKIGYFNVFVDADGILRRVPLVMEYGSGWREGERDAEVNYYPSLDIQILRTYLGLAEHEMQVVYNKGGVEAVELGELRIPTDLGGRLLVHYQGGPNTYPHYSMADVIEGKFEPGTFRDKIVLVGPTAQIINDFRPSPFAEATHTGVEIHANLLDTILQQRFIRRGIREQLLDLLVILIFGLVAGFFLARVQPLQTFPVFVGFLGIFSVAAYLALAHGQVWINMVVPGNVLVANYGTILFYRIFFVDREKRKTRAAFTQYVPPALVRELMKDPKGLKLGGEERELSIMFSDIRGFTSLSERLTALELTTFLNDYTDEMTDIIFRHWGTLDKYEGDAIMAFWGAPYIQDDHSLRACAAALDQGKRMDELRRKWKEEGKPDINIGLGINTGQVVVGNMGSRKRFNYTVLGDPVNLASRLEGVNKEYSTRIIISESTYKQAAGAFDVLTSRVARHFDLPADELRSSNGNEIAQRARRCALYVGSRQKLAAPRALALQFGFDGEEQFPALVGEVEQWVGRDKKLARALGEISRGLHQFLFRQLDWIRVKGKLEPVGIFELVDFGENEPDWAGLLGLFDAGLQAYRNRQWDFAIDLFQSVLDQRPEDGPARLFIERCREYMVTDPGESWDGVHVMTTK